MGLFTKRAQGHSVALIDIGSSSVGGAYAHFEEGKQPVIYYTARVDIEPKKDEGITESMLRSLAFLERLLIEEGAPQLRRETGSGSVAKVLVTVAAPWQETKVTQTHIEKPEPFTFTRAHLEEAARAIAPTREGRVSSGYKVISTALNGYEIPHPFGKRVRRADLVLLSSSLEKHAIDRVRASLRRAFHAHDVVFLAFAPVASEVFAHLHPAQGDFVVLDVSGAGTDLAFVKRGHLREACTVACGTHHLLKAATDAGKRAHVLDESIVHADEEFARETEQAARTWLEGVYAACAQVAAKEALPRTVFLLADPEYQPYLGRILGESTLRSLWLTDEPLELVPVAPGQLAEHVKTRGLGEGDAFLMVLALYAQGL